MHHLKKLNKKELKFLTKPWITQGLQNSIKKKNNIYSKFVKCKNQKLKEFYHNNFKTYRNLLLTLLKRVKEKYFTKFFNENIKNIKDTYLHTDFKIRGKLFLAWNINFSHLIEFVKFVILFVKTLQKFTFFIKNYKNLLFNCFYV